MLAADLHIIIDFLMTWDVFCRSQGDQEGNLI